MEGRGSTVEELAPLISGEEGKELQDTGDLDRGISASGQVIGLIRDIPTVQQLITSIIDEAEEIMSRMTTGTVSEPIRKPAGMSST